MKQKIHTTAAPKAIGIYSQAIKIGNHVYLSGQIPLNPSTMELIGIDFKSQAEQVIKNMQQVCEAAGGSLQNIVKLTIFLTDLSHFQILNDLMKEYFTEPYPTRSTVQVSALPKNALIEIEGIMVF